VRKLINEFSLVGVVEAVFVSIIAVVFCYVVILNKLTVLKTIRRRAVYLILIGYAMFLLGFATLPAAICHRNSILSSTLVILGLIFINSNFRVKNLKDLAKIAPLVVIAYNIPTLINTAYSFLIIYTIQSLRELIPLRDWSFQNYSRLSQWLFGFQHVMFILSYQTGLKGEIFFIYILLHLTAWITVFYSSMVAYEYLRRWF